MLKKGKIKKSLEVSLIDASRDAFIIILEYIKQPFTHEFTADYLPLTSLLHVDRWIVHAYLLR